MSCFASGTKITTETGEVAVENLRPGDKVLTRDHGVQPVRWVGLKPMSGRFLLDHPHLRPVFVCKGAFGGGLPLADTMMSPNARVPVACDAEGFLGRSSEDMVALKNLVNHRGIQQIDTTGMVYVHIMLSGHEIIAANGVWVETFKAGDRSLKNIGNAQRLEILEVFPDLAASCARAATRANTSGKAARGLLRRFI